MFIDTNYHPTVFCRTCGSRKVYLLKSFNEKGYATYELLDKETNKPHKDTCKKDEDNTIIRHKI